MEPEEGQQEGKEALGVRVVSLEVVQLVAEDEAKLFCRVRARGQHRYARALGISHGKRGFCVFVTDEPDRVFKAELFRFLLPDLQYRCVAFLAGRAHDLSAKMQM